MSRTKAALSGIPETLLLSVWGRAQATRQGSRILSDPQAVEVVGKLDYDFARVGRATSTMSYAQWVAVAKQFDRLVTQYIEVHPACTVVNLGAGLDTAFGRVDNGQLRWFDVDLPEVIELRRAVLPETDRSRCIAGSILDAAWMDAIGDPRGGVFLVASSVLFYFTEAEVRSLFRALHHRFPGAHIAFNTVNRRAMAYANKMVRRGGMKNAVLTWAIEDPQSLSAWGTVELVEWFPLFHGIPREGLNLKTRLAMWLVDRQKMNAVVHAVL